MGPMGPLSAHTHQYPPTPVNTCLIPPSPARTRLRAQSAGRPPGAAPTHMYPPARSPTKKVCPYLGRARGASQKIPNCSPGKTETKPFAKRKKGVRIRYICIKRGFYLDKTTT